MAQHKPLIYMTKLPFPGSLLYHSCLLIWGFVLQWTQDVIILNTSKNHDKALNLHFFHPTK